MKTNLIFDYDGTLHNTSALYIKGFRKGYAYLVDNGLTEDKVIPDSYITSLLGLNTSEIWDKVHPNLEDKHKIACSAIIQDEINSLIKQNKAFLYDGVQSMLKELKDVYNLIFLSNCNIEYMNRHIEYFKLDEYFSGFYNAEEFKFIPKYEIFKQIKKDFPGEYVVAGDRFKDIEVGTINNFTSIGCLYGHGLKDELKDATYLVSDVDELKSLLIKIA